MRAKKGMVKCWRDAFRNLNIPMFQYANMPILPILQLVLKTCAGKASI
jgi:hypothetical protein